ncbi:MAG: TVP38/TMEM64 family protein [Deltaproteobacteria bacterium]|nr:TVP38/TMEM64 family protein [Deltaproteobacteria bacterium]
MLSSLAVAVTAYLKGWIEPTSLRRWVTQAGPLGAIGLVGGVVLFELLWLPRMWGLLAAGVLFGALWGCLLTIVGDLCGAVLCYAIAKGAGHRWVQAALAERRRAARVVELLAHRRGGWLVAVLRVCPIAHYTLVSYAAGMAGVPFWPYFWGTALGILPAAILYPLLGDAALRPTSPLFIFAMALVAAALIVTLLATRRLLRDAPPGR